MPKKCLPDDLTRHFDRDWKTQKSTLRELKTQHLNYHPAHSWDAMSDNPQRFSRLESKEVPFQSTRPCTLSGSQVILLENPQGMSIFNASVGSNVPRVLPLTTKQQDIGMDPSLLRPSSPILAKAQREGKLVLMEKEDAFQNYRVAPPIIKTEDIPDFYVKAGPLADRVLLKPAQRRQIMEFDAKKMTAEKYIKAAMSERIKLNDALHGPSHHRGVLMYDTCDNVNSEVYGDKARRNWEKEERLRQAHENRTQHIAKCTGTLRKDWGDLVPATASQEPYFRIKGGPHSTLGLEETKDRLFCRTAIPVNPLRTQNLRNRESNGKKYDIVTHTGIEYIPSNAPEQVNIRMAHPSQTSLDGPRNLQGSIRRR